MTRPAVTEGDLLPLIHLIYDAAMEKDRWSDVVHEFCRVFRADAGAVYLYDGPATRGSISWHSGVPAEVLVGFDRWAPFNPHIRAFEGQVRTGAYTANSPVRRDEYFASVYHNEFMKPLLPLYAAAGCCIFEGPTTKAVVSVDRLHSRPDFESETAGIWPLLLPHLQRAAFLSLRLGDLELAHSTSMAALDRLGFGVAFLSARGEVVRMNEAASRLLQAGECLRLDRHGNLTCRAGAARGRFESLVASACAKVATASQPGGGWLRLEGEEETLELFVSPVPPSVSSGAARPAAAILYLRAVQESVPAAPTLQLLFGLTQAESRVAQALAGGASVGEIADESSVAISTVRSQVRSILGKVGARSLADLTRRLASILPVR